MRPGWLIRLSEMATSKYVLLLTQHSSQHSYQEYKEEALSCSRIRGVNAN